MTKAFIFDLDGVLTDTAHYHFLAWKKLADKLGLPFDETDNERLKGVSRAASLDIILERASKEYTLDEKHAMMESKNEDYKDLIAHMTPDDVFPGVREVFAELKSRGIKIALASASKNAPDIVKRLGIAADFDYIADAGAVAHSKPAPDIFLLAAKGAGVTPAESVGIEDAIAGIESIHAAGMPAVGIGDSAILTEAELVFPDMLAFDVAKVLAIAPL